MSKGSTGNITRRGERSWRIKYEVGRDPVTGKRRTAFATVRGTKRDAQAELTRRLNEVETGQHVKASPMTVAEYARHWLADIAPSRAGAKTRERYADFIEKNIIPQLGSVPLQKLDGASIDRFYAHLRTAGRRDGKGGLSALTCRHIHRLLTQILSAAVMAGKLRQSPMAAVQTAPTKVEQQEEVHVLGDDEMATLFGHLKKDSPLRMPVMVAAATGMRRGELLGLRWRDVDLEAATLRVEQVIEETKAGLALKAPKTKRSRRTIALPARLVQELRAHRREQAEFRLKLGVGKDGAPDLVFPSLTTLGLQSPRAFTKAFLKAAAGAGLPHIHLHGLRHTHITHLLRSGVPVHVVSERAGHSNPTVTLGVYAHVLAGQQESAAAAFDKALRGALGE